MKSRDSKTFRGRGAGDNPANRFERIHLSLDPVDPTLEPAPATPTTFYHDSSRSIVTENKSPDIGFDYSVNPYRGCEHGCAYCYARPSHEYLGLSAGLDFETKIFVKMQAAVLLREKLMKQSWKPALIVMSGITDCYQPIERKLELTRECLKVLSEFRNPVAVITKNRLVTRDTDILREMAKESLAHVTLSITTLDPTLAADLEPRTSRPDARLDAIRTLAAAGIPVSVNIAPIIPGLNDHEVPAILEASAQAGAKSAHYTLIRLPLAVMDVFTDWLDRKQPLRKEKILNMIRELRGGRLNDANFGSRMTGTGVYADQIRQMFSVYCRRYGLAPNEEPFVLSTEKFRRPSGPQLEFDLAP